LAVRRSPDGEEETLLLYDRPTQQLVVAQGRARLAGLGERGLAPGSCPLPANGVVRLHAFVDRSVIELFGNERVGLTHRVYPSRPDCDRVAAVAFGGSATLRSLRAWPLRSIWADPSP
jgi:sucrose-6-phosphate hydrolase SacC (GH32 family)